MSVILEGKVKYKDKKRWKLRFCVIYYEPEKQNIELHILKDPAEFRPPPRFDANRNASTSTSPCSNSIPSEMLSASAATSPNQLYPVLSPAECDLHLLVSRPLDYIYGCESGRHVDKERCVLALIGAQTVHCMSLSNLEEMFRWAKVLEGVLLDFQCHVCLVKCSDGSRLSPNTPGSLHVQPGRLCLVAEPAQGNKFICAWRFTDVESVDVLEYQERQCLLLLAAKSAGKDRGKHIFSMDEESLKNCLAAVERCKIMSWNPPPSSNPPTSVGTRKETSVLGFPFASTSFRACIPRNSNNNVISRDNSARESQRQSGDIVGVSGGDGVGLSRSSTQTSAPAMRHLDSTSTLMTLRQQQHSNEPLMSSTQTTLLGRLIGPDNIFSTDEDLTEQEQHLLENSVALGFHFHHQHRHYSVDNGCVARFPGGESYTTTATSSGWSEDRRSSQGSSYPSHYVGGENNPYPTDQLGTALFHLGGQPLRMCGHPQQVAATLSKSHAPQAICRSLEPHSMSPTMETVASRSSAGHAVLTTRTQNCRFQSHFNRCQVSDAYTGKCGVCLKAQLIEPSVEGMFHPGLMRFSLWRRGLRTCSSLDDVHLLERVRTRVRGLPRMQAPLSQPQQAQSSSSSAEPASSPAQLTQTQSVSSSLRTSVMNPSKALNLSKIHPAGASRGTKVALPLNGIHEEVPATVHRNSLNLNLNLKARHSYAGSSSADAASSTPQDRLLTGFQPPPQTGGGSSSVKVAPSSGSGSVRIRAISDHIPEAGRMHMNPQQQQQRHGMSTRSPHHATTNTGEYVNVAQQQQAPFTRGSPARFEMTHIPDEMRDPRRNYAYVDVTRSRNSHVMEMLEKSVHTDSGGTIPVSSISSPVNYTIIIPDERSGRGTSSHELSSYINISAAASSSSSSSFCHTSARPPICGNTSSSSSSAIPAMTSTSCAVRSGVNYTRIDGVRTQALGDLMTPDLPPMSMLTMPVSMGGSVMLPTPQQDRLQRSRSVASSSSGRGHGHEFTTDSGSLSAKSVFGAIKSFVAKKPSELSPPSGE